MSAFLHSNIASAQIISTYAGDTTAGYTGDGHQATDAQINRPSGVATDFTGNLYIVDSASNCVRKVDTAGIITTFAGTGTAGYNGDGIAATAAQLNNPSSVTTDRSGNVYICDHSNERIRKVDVHSIITTIFYDTTSIYGAQIIVINQAGTLYFSSAGRNIYKLVLGSPVLVAPGGTIAGTGVSLDLIGGLPFDSVGNLYMGNSEGSPGQILKLDTSGTLTVAVGAARLGLCENNVAASSAGLDNVTGIVMDDSGYTNYICKSH